MQIRRSINYFLIPFSVIFGASLTCLLSGEGMVANKANTVAAFIRLTAERQMQVDKEMGN